MTKWSRLLVYLIISILIPIFIYILFKNNPTEGFIDIKQEVLVSGQAFHDVCKYNLDYRYPIVRYDDNVREGDLVFLKVKDITSFVMKPPGKKVRLIVGNNDETFNDHYMGLVKPYVTKVYAVNSSAEGAIQIPMGFRDSQYTPHTTMFDIDKEPYEERTILCLVNFIMATTNQSFTAKESYGERQRALDAFTGKDWITISDYIKYDFEKSLNHSDEETKRRRLDYYKQLKHTKFVICPPGAGMDTHRIYESLFFGCIPIIKSSFLDPMYNKLGGCWIVQNWGDITQEECERRWQSKTGATPLFDINNWLDISESFQDNNNTISFITYGNQAFHLARERIGREAKDMGIFNGTIKLYSPDDLTTEFKEKVNDTLGRARGGGYWIWKPYIIHDMLSKLNANDYLVYADAGCTLNKKAVARLREYIQTISIESHKSIFSMVLNGLPEHHWTTAAVFNHFNIDKNSDIYKSNQVLGGISIYRKSEDSMEFVKAWLNTAMSNPELFTDDYNEEAKRENADFKEARHDQSIFSVLIKSEPHHRHAVFFNDEVDNPDENAPIKAKRQRS